MHTLTFLLRRPIAVLMSFVVLFTLSVLAYRSLPVSLLPAIDVPQIFVKVNYPNASPTAIEQNVLKAIREQLLTLAHLKDIQSLAQSESGTVRLDFEYGTQMDLAYIAVQEKIDRITNALPRDLPRPQVVRVNTADVPIIKLQVVPRQAEQMPEVSELAEKVLKKRLEAIEGVSLVDLNGTQKRQILIQTDDFKLEAFQLEQTQIQQSIQNANVNLGSLSVQDGQYRYFVKLGTTLQNARELQNIPLRLREGKVIQLQDIATIKDTIAQVQGWHLFNQNPAIVINIHKQAQAKLPALMPLIMQSIAQFKADYPNIDFQTTQNQYFLLDVAISNLVMDLGLGGLFAFLVVLVFLGSFRVSFLIGVVLPSSLLLSFIVFYIFQISLNIISLSGLTLGLGMTIDNAIIIFDNISRKRREGLALFESCVQGTAEMIAPLLSSAITTLGVFFPLIFLSGIAGALSYEQAVAVGAILFTSILVSFTLLPLLYWLLFSRRESLPKEENQLYRFILKFYKKIHHFTFTHQRWTFPVLLALSFASLGLFFVLKVETLPTLQKNDSLLKIDWNEAIDATQNKARIESLLAKFDKSIVLHEADLGLRQFLLQTETSSLQTAQVYLLFKNPQIKAQVSTQIQQHLTQAFPQASVKILDAPNTFDLLFQQNKPYYEIRFKNSTPLAPIPIDTFQRFTQNLQKKWHELNLGQGTSPETTVQLALDLQKLNNYGIKPENAIQKLQTLFGNQTIAEIKNFNDILPIRSQNNLIDLENQLQNTQIKGDSAQYFPLKQFASYQFQTDYKSLAADKSGIFHALTLDNLPDKSKLDTSMQQQALQKGWSVSFEGQYFDNQENLQQMAIILAVSIALLYFVLAIEFESLRQPLIVLLTLPLGFGGSLFLLWACGASLNLMSAMGLVVMLGIIDNETILKIDTYNRLRKTMPLKEAIQLGGEICFKPVWMTSLTNIFALLPVLFSVGMGADLQFPFVLAIIGGLGIGTFTALFFVPLAYYYVEKMIFYPIELGKNLTA